MLALTFRVPWKAATCLPAASAWAVATWQAVRAWSSFCRGMDWRSTRVSSRPCSSSARRCWLAAARSWAWARAIWARFWAMEARASSREPWALSARAATSLGSRVAITAPAATGSFSFRSRLRIEPGIRAATVTTWPFT